MTDRARRRRSSSTPTSRETSSCAPGRRSRYYLDKYRFETRPDLLQPLGERIAAAVAEHAPDATRLAGPELGAVALAAAASLQSGLPFIIVRKAAKEYGTAKRIEGPYEEGECICLIEDVVTSGGALLDSVEALRAAGLVVHTAVCVVDREEGGADALARHAVRLRPLFRAGELLGRHEKSRKTAWLSRTGGPGRVNSARGTDQRQEERHVTKQEFVAEVANRSQLTARDAGKAVDAVLETITDTLKSGGEVAFTGFGKFTAQNRAARTGVNPRNPTEKVHIPAARVPKFSAGSQLKAAVKGG